jgi:sterol desaturase/sphingolipid hydroxylase (fatty acid hydroxylase superfamily)
MTTMPKPTLDRVIYFALQPMLASGVLVFWYFNQDLASSYILSILIINIVLALVEHWRPARPDWVQRWREKSRNIVLVVILIMGAGLVVGFYDSSLRGPLADLRQTLGIDFWPHQWPLLVQVFMVFFLSEFIWYWMHRAEHRWDLVWRVSGHGAHHAFKHLGAINFGANHPLELFFIALPSALVELFFGVGLAAAGAAAFSVTQASIAHSNIRMNTNVVGWLFTTNRYHIHHHSSILEESNTNYGCSAIVWDRVFGTFEDAGTVDTGTGPTEPSLWQKFIMPVREPVDTATAPSNLVA